MKTIAKTKARTPRHRPAKRVHVATKLTDEEFRRKLHIDLADEIAAARKAAQARFGHLLRPPTPAELKASLARWEAVQEEARRHPVSREESESYDRMLTRMAAEHAG